MKPRKRKNEKTEKPKQAKIKNRKVINRSTNKSKISKHLNLDKSGNRRIEKLKKQNIEKQKI